MCVYRIPQGTNYTRAACDYCYARDVELLDTVLDSTRCW